MSHADTADTAALVRSLAIDVTILLIEHDIGLVMNLSDTVVVMHQGQRSQRPAQWCARPRGADRLFGHA